MPGTLDDLVTYVLELFDEDGSTVDPVTLVCCWTLDHPVV